MVLALGDGPMREHELVAIGYPLVPPGRAARYYDSRVRGRSDDDRVVIGQRQIAKHSLHSMEQTGTIGQQRVDGEDWVFLTPMGYKRFFTERRLDAEDDE